MNFHSQKKKKKKKKFKTYFGGKKRTAVFSFKKRTKYGKNVLLATAGEKSSECSGMLDAQPATVYPASPDDPSRNLKFGFWSEHHCIYFLTIVLSTIVESNWRDEI